MANPFERAFWLNPGGAVGFGSGGVDLGDPNTAAQLGIASGLLQGWSPMPTSMGQALGAGLRGGQASYRDAVAAKRLQHQQQLQEGMQKMQRAKLVREQQAYEAQQAAIAQLPPGQQSLAQIAPGQFVSGQYKAPKAFTAQNFYNPDKPSEIVTVQSPEEQQRAIDAGFVKGNPPKGWTVETGPEGTTVSYGTSSGESGELTKSTRTQLQKDVLSGEDMSRRLDIIDKEFKPEYLEYGGKSKAWIQEKLNKAGLSEGEFAAERADWLQDTQAFFNDYRKAITGAAAGVFELGEIAKAIPTPNDSPATFKAKLESAQKWQRYLNKRRKAALDAGITPALENPEYLQFADDYAKENPRPSYQAGVVTNGPTMTAETLNGLTPQQLQTIDVGTIPEALLPRFIERLTENGGS